MRKIFVIITICFVLGSCVKEFPLKPSGKMETLPVVYMFIEPDSVPAANFSHAADIANPILPENAADIAVYRNGNLLGSMVAMGSGNYSLAANTFKPRDSFKIKCSDGQKTFEVVGAVPSRVKITRVDTETILVPGLGEAFNLKLMFSDSAIDTNYYRLYLKKNYYQYKLDQQGKRIDSTLMQNLATVNGSELPFIQNNFNQYTSKEILFTDGTFNGVDSVILGFYTSDKLSTTAQFRAISVEVVLENISLDLFNYYNTRNAHLWQQQSISQLPGSIQGNIPGVYGVISAFTFARKVINLGN